MAPEFSMMVDEITSGAFVALEVSGEGAKTPSPRSASSRARWTPRWRAPCAPNRCAPSSGSTRCATPCTARISPRTARSRRTTSSRSCRKRRWRFDDVYDAPERTRVHRHRCFDVYIDMCIDVCIDRCVSSVTRAHPPRRRRSDARFFFFSVMRSVFATIVTDDGTSASHRVGVRSSGVPGTRSSTCLEERPIDDHRRRRHFDLTTLCAREFRFSITNARTPSRRATRSRRARLMRA